MLAGPESLALLCVQHVGTQDDLFCDLPWHWDWQACSSLYPPSSLFCRCTSCVITPRQLWLPQLSRAAGRWWRGLQGALLSPPLIPLGGFHLAPWTCACLYSRFWAFPLRFWELHSASCLCLTAQGLGTWRTGCSRDFYLACISSFSWNWYTCSIPKIASSYNFCWN